MQHYPTRRAERLAVGWGDLSEMVEIQPSGWSLRLEHERSGAPAKRSGKRREIERSAVSEVSDSERSERRGGGAVRSDRVGAGRDLSHRTRLAARPVTGRARRRQSSLDRRAFVPHRAPKRNNQNLSRFFRDKIVEIIWRAS